MAARQRLGVGIIGAGNISSQYLKAMKDFPVLDIRAIADMKPEVAAKKAAEFGVKAVPVEVLLADPAVDILVNLTIPRAHVDVGLRAIAAGKHVYSEKPLGVNFEEGKKLIAAARRRGVRVGSAPDTFLGGGHQQARAVVDSGKLGTIIGGTASFGVPGHEYWHPDPAFYYDIGGGPVLDMGPYYVTDLVNLLGPVKAVQAMSLTPAKERPVRSEPKKGQLMKVKVFTHVTGTLQFVSGALVQVSLSFDVPKHTHKPIEIYGTEGAMQVPRPELVRRRSEDRQAAGGTVGRRSGQAPLCRCKLPLAGRRRHGLCHPQQPPAPGERRAGAACARSDGSVRGGEQIGPDGQDQDQGRTPGAAGGVVEARQDFLSPIQTQNSWPAVTQSSPVCFQKMRFHSAGSAPILPVSGRSRASMR